jgi:hypothetical protein
VGKEASKHTINLADGGRDITRKKEYHTYNRN